MLRKIVCNETAIRFPKEGPSEVHAGRAGSATQEELHEEDVEATTKPGRVAWSDQHRLASNFSGRNYVMVARLSNTSLLPKSISA